MTLMMRYFFLLKDEAVSMANGSGRGGWNSRLDVERTYLWRFGQLSAYCSSGLISAASASISRCLPEADWKGEIPMDQSKSPMAF